jgi:hypothetical protein
VLFFFAFVLDVLYTSSIGGKMGERIKELEEKRKHVGERLIDVGDMRQGTVYARFSKCGKMECRCANEKGYLHGPTLSLTKKVKGKTVLRTIPKEAIETTKEQIAKFQEFRRLSQEFLAVNEEICEAKLVEPRVETDRAQKKTSKIRLKPK